MAGAPVRVGAGPDGTCRRGGDVASLTLFAGTKLDPAVQRSGRLGAPGQQRDQRQQDDHGVVLSI
jgi:hypothetical protein